MIVDDFDVRRACFRPAKTDPPLIVDANAVLPHSIALESLQAIAGRRAQRRQQRRGVEHVELARGDFRERPPRRRDDAVAEKSFGADVSEIDDHGASIRYVSRIGKARDVRRRTSCHHAGFLSRTPAPPPFSAMNSTPADSSAARMAARLLAIGERFPVSKSRIVDTLTREASASRGCDQFKRARAARDCGGEIIATG